ncbi:MAG: helix-turn-helix transcriptional regulator [Neptuniibacter sp.]|nr:helix-turn-helix transcriptional regulator [Neptuniibacter sp.]
MKDMEGVLLQLKQQQFSQETSVLALECNWEHLLQEIQDLLSQLGFVSYSYSVIKRGLLNTSVESDGQRGKDVDIQGTLPASLVDTYNRDISHNDPLWDVLPSITSPLLINSSSTAYSPFSEKFWKRHGISSRVYIPMPGRNSTYWFHYFGLYHEMPADEFTVYFSKISEWLVPILIRYHEVLQVVSEAEQNPYLKKQPLSPTCLQVMKMTAQGMPVKSIADELALTEEGITYHITRAKRIFGARNKTQLVGMMYEIGLL